MESCILGAWRRGRSSVRTSPSTSGALACPRGSLGSTEPELARRVGLDEVEKNVVDGLLESIGKELSTEELDELEKQRRQLEEEVEAG